MAFAARASLGVSIGYLETSYFSGVGEQSAVLWQNGVLALGSSNVSSDSSLVGRRPRSPWPVNALLHGLGLCAGGHDDEFDALGRGSYRSFDEIAKRAQLIERQG